VSRRLLSGKGFSHGAVAAWTPASLGAALIAWYKADAGVYTDNGTTLATNGQSVQQWNDQSGNGFHLHQTAGINKPTYLTGVLNSLPVIDSNAGSNPQGMFTTGEPVTSLTTALSAFAVVKVTANPLSNARVMGIYAAAGGGDVASTTAIPISLLGSTIVTITAYNNGSKGTGTISSGTWNQVGSIFDSANSTIYVANTPGTPISASPTFAATIDLEVMIGIGSNGPTGQIAECIFTNSALSSTDRSNLATYFTTKWGV
jgi:hypothetical protein